MTSERNLRPRRLARVLSLVSGEDERAATAVLGSEHVLSRMLARRRTLSRQILVTSLSLLLAAAGVTLGVGDAPIVLGAAAAVELALLLAALFVRLRTRDVVQELIAAGNDAAFALPVVQAEGRRLVSRREREHFARSLERLLRDAQRWHRIFPAYRPPDGTQFLRFVPDEVCEVVRLLRAESAHVRGVALTARLLMDGGASPLYAGNVGRLREELNRIRYLLAGPVEAAHGEAPPIAA
jgi:hypothetical protein